MTPLPHFFLTDDLVASMPRPEVVATITALKECGLLKYPYPEFTLAFRPSAFDEECGRIAGQMRLTVTVFAGEEFRRTGYYPILVADLDDGRSTTIDVSDCPVEVHHGWHQMFSHACCLLVAALATKNTTISTTYNKRAARGIGNGPMRMSNGVIHLSRTVIDLPPAEHDSTGRRMPRHLRRGHVHRWRKGDGYVSKFLNPIWVNDRLGGATKTPQYEVKA